MMESDKSILLIEDNTDDEWLILKMFEDLGILNVTVAPDGLSALTMLHGNQKTGESATCKPDRILLDLRLPRRDGIDVLRAIRANESTRDVKVFVVSASNHPDDIDICKELGVITYIDKPLNIRKINDMVLS